MLSQKNRDKYTNNMELCIKRLEEKIPDNLKYDFENICTMARYGMETYCEIMNDGEEDNGTIRSS